VLAQIFDAYKDNYSTSIVLVLLTTTITNDAFMNVIGIFIGLAGLLLIFSVIWMMVMSVKQKNLESEKQAREDARRRAIVRHRAQERQEKVQKAEANHIPSILFLAKEAEMRDFKEAVYWYEKAGLLGNVTGMYGIARLSKRYNDDPVMMEKAKFWQLYIKGIEGDQEALFDTGKALLAGLGVAVDREKGIEVIERAALANFVPAQIYMGDWCLSGESITAKAEDSTYWFSKAAKRENSEAMMKLGMNYIKGRGTVKDHKRGCFWLESAAERGDAAAMYQAGTVWIDNGKYGNSIAYIWLYLSAKAGYEPAKTLRDEVANKLGVDSIVFLQGFANPLHKKLYNGSVPNHLVIRALNRLYKRGVPLLNQHAQEGSPDEEDNKLLNVLLDQEQEITQADTLKDE
jgi:uncharacterized protein